MKLVARTFELLEIVLMSDQLMIRLTHEIIRSEYNGFLEASFSLPIEETLSRFFT